MESDELGLGGWGGEGLVTGLLPLVGTLGLLLVGVALLALLALRRARSVDPGAVPPADPALALLRERYARGELDTEAYAERRRGLLDGSELR